MTKKSTTFIRPIIKVIAKHSLELFRTFMRQNTQNFLFDWYSWSGGLPIPSCINKHITNSKKRVLFITALAKPISEASKQEHNKSKTHDNTGNSKSQTPAKVVLNVVQYPEGHQQTTTHSKIPPIEEWAFSFTFFWVLSIKLVRSKSLYTRLVPSLSKSY